MTTKNKSTFSAEAILEKMVGPLSMAMILSANRKSELKTLAQYAKTLGVSKAHLCDIEKGRRLVSASRAARFAKKTGASPIFFMAVAIEDMLRKDGFKLKVELKEAS